MMMSRRNSAIVTRYDFASRFECELNWTAAEANWRLLIEPIAALNYETTEAACFVGEHRGGRPGPWTDDVYTGVSWTDVCMTARDQQDAAEEEREDVIDDDLEINTPPDDAPDASDKSTFLDLNEFATELDSVLQNHDEDDNPDDDEAAWSPFGTAPPGAPPAYRAGEANTMAAEQSDDERRAQPAVRRSWYLDDEASESR